MSGLLAIIVMFCGAGSVVLLLVGLSHWLGPKKPNPVKSEIFECGNLPISDPSGRYSVKFYTVAILFVLFDIEIVFLFPWAVVFRQIGAPALITMALFIAILVFGLVYAWRKGALQWD